MDRHTALLMALVLGIATLGCAHSHTEDHLGESHRTLTAQMVANPEASDEVRPVEGIGATTAEQVTGNYHRRQQEQPQQDKPASLLDLVSGR